MILKRVSWVMIFLLVITVSLVGCGGGGGGGHKKKTTPPIIINISGGNNVDVSAINSKGNKFGIITYMDESEGWNDLDENLYSPTLMTTNQSAGNTAFPSRFAPNSSSKEVYSKKQIDCDTMMRLRECQLSASRNRQFSKAAGYNPAAPANPIENTTTWDVIIAYTGNTISTTCRKVSNQAYFFVDNRDTADMTPFLDDYAAKFETIYATNHSHFGIENDVDDNDHVIIVFSRELSGGLLGYFYARDKYLKVDYADSNEGDIFYMTTTPQYQGNIVLGTLAHEFQHMIYFDQHINQGITLTDASVWLNEALSQAAEYYNNYLDNHLGWIKNYLYCSDSGPSLASWYFVSLTHWTNYNYGASAIFIRYLIDQYGDNAVKTIAQSKKLGIAAVEEATGQEFNTIFGNFSKALLLSDVAGADSLYKFKTLTLKDIQTKGRGGLYVPDILTASPGASGTVDVYPYNFTVFIGNGSFSTMSLSAGNAAGWAIGY